MKNFTITLTTDEWNEILDAVSLCMIQLSRPELERAAASLEAKLWKAKCESEEK